MSKGRLEAFSDGVIAILITIMVLGLPQPEGVTLSALRPLLWRLLMLVIGWGELDGWSPPFSPALMLIALVLIVGGYAIGVYALIDNRFFSGVVRLQTDRGHHVISSGPYARVRHPGYAGGILTYLATPFFLDSSWALLPTPMLRTVLVLRTRLEDRFLQENLEGYREYAVRVRYRLLPGLWCGGRE
jgi:protein-S-isoprenylcysteine O-methyltransferase Ste14